MATLKQKIEAEAAGRRLLVEGGLPQPDGVEYGHTCIRFLWNERKVALVIEIDEPPNDLATTGGHTRTPGDVSEFRDLSDLCRLRELSDLDGWEDPDDSGDSEEWEDEAA